MSAPLPMASPGGADNGDVLASIRRLISSGDAAGVPVAPQGTATGNPSSNIPLRLRPDALVASSDMGAPSEPLVNPAPPGCLADPALLPPGHADSAPRSPGRAAPPEALMAVGVLGEPPEPPANPAPADPALRSPGRADSAPLPRNLPEDAPAPHYAPPPADPTVAAVAAVAPTRAATALVAQPESHSDDKGTAMHAPPTATAPHFHLDATAEAAKAEALPHLHMPAPDSPASAATPAENPLRALLRGAVRDELEHEMRHRLETDLRQLIRAELSAALTEALIRPTAA